jgi:hypothetical protein
MAANVTALEALSPKVSLNASTLSPSVKPINIKMEDLVLNGKINKKIM